MVVRLHICPWADAPLSACQAHSQHPSTPYYPRRCPENAHFVHSFAFCAPLLCILRVLSPSVGILAVRFQALCSHLLRLAPSPTDLLHIVFAFLFHSASASRISRECFTARIPTGPKKSPRPLSLDHENTLLLRFGRANGHDLCHARRTQRIETQAVLLRLQELVQLAA